MSDLSDATFKAVLAESAFALVDFWSPWCSPCKQMIPLVNRVKETVEGLEVYKVNTDECPQIATFFRVQGVPTMLLLKRGVVQSVKVGSMTFAALVKWIEDHR